MLLVEVSGLSIKYVMPDWDDYLDTGFDFKNDSFSEPVDGAPQRAYLHEIMGDATPYDGILVSLNQIEKKKGALKKYGITGAEKSIRQIMRIPDRIKVIGDCGAFSYKDAEQPEIDPVQAAKLYNDYEFDYGASVDHMVIDEITIVNEKGEKEKHTLSEDEKCQRVKITIENAKAFIEEVKKKGYKFTPLGSIQARNAKEYADVFDQFIQMGYRQVALGSLIPKDDETIREIITAVGERYRKLDSEIRSEVGIHLFGILRPALFEIYKENGVASFDSASYFRKAWLKSDRNYLSTEGKWYAAIRVPQTELARNSKALAKSGYDLASVKELERDVLTSLNSFDKKTDIDHLLNKLIKYDSYFERTSDGGEKLREAYRKVLTDRPWEKCSCSICKSIGIHVLVFRGYNRNKRRGFHNTYVFYHSYNGGVAYEHK